MPTPPKRLVIFGCGYVGTAVALEAMAHGIAVTALTRNAANAVVLREQGIEVITADLADQAWHERIPVAPDFALNCVSSGGAGIAGYERSYVRGMESVIAWARRVGPVGTLVYTSSTSVYPQGGGIEVDEEAPTGGAESTERARLLLAAEDMLRAAPPACRRWFILRLAGIYGPGRHHLLEQVKQGEVSGLAAMRLNLIHRDDIVTAIMACFAAPAAVANAVFNVVDDAPTAKAEVVAWLAERLAQSPPRFTGQPVGGRRELTPDRVVRNGRVKAALGWQPRFPSYRDGFAKLVSNTTAL